MTGGMYMKDAGGRVEAAFSQDGSRMKGHSRRSRLASMTLVFAIFAAGFPQSQRIQCDTLSPVDVVDQTMTAGSSSLSYDPATSTYTYVWKTEKSWAGTCRQFTVQLIDGQTYTLLFKFK